MTARSTVLIAMFAALTAALGLLPPLPVPVIPVPVTAQTLGVMLAGSLLGARKGAASQLLFVLLVAAGLPLLAGGRGGLGAVFGPTGGYLLAWPLAAGMIGWLTRFHTRSPLWLFGANTVGGIFVVYAAGIPWTAVVADLSLAQSALAAAAFLPGDLFKAGFAAFITLGVRRAYPRSMR